MNTSGKTQAAGVWALAEAPLNLTKAKAVEGTPADDCLLLSSTFCQLSLVECGSGENGGARYLDANTAPSAYLSISS